MVDEAELTWRKSLSFRQAEGLEDPPSQLARDVVTPVLKARLWVLIYNRLLRDRILSHRYYMLEGGSFVVMRKYLITVRGVMIDELNQRFEPMISHAKVNFSQEADYAKVFEFTQWFLREMGDAKLSANIASVLSEERAAYRIYDSDTIAPLVSEQEGIAFEGALSALGVNRLEGARDHLSNAGGHLTSGKFRDSVRESIHAVESVVTSKTGEKTLPAGLRKLDRATPLHPAFRLALDKLYAYTSDKEGIRHSLLDKDSDVTEREAIFMIGACSAFVTYLLAED